MTFTTVYRTGGTANAKWHAALPVATREEADRQREEVERMGYKALVKTTREVELHGLPEGWDGKL